MKPCGLESRKIKKTIINDYSIVQLEIDLRHINYGLDSNQDYKRQARSDFTAEEIVEVFESMNDLSLLTKRTKDFEYFVYENNFWRDQRLFRIVFCIAPTAPTLAGVITFFRIK